MTTTLIDKKEAIEKDVELLINKADTIIENSISKIKNEIIAMYFNIGKMIVDYKNENNSKYGESVINVFVKELHLKRGMGFNKSNIYYAIKFYETFAKFQTSGKSMNQNLTWSHMIEILNLNDLTEMKCYIKEVSNKKLTIKEVRSAIKSKSFERTIANQKKGSIKNKIEKTLKDPLILNIPNKKRTEKELEDEIVKNISNFKKEIGNIVTFYERQYKININGLIHKVDLVFLDYETNTFILVDLKINKVTNHDIMQMQLYIKYFSKELKNKKTNVTGLILCETKDLRLIENDNIYQIKYLNEIPKEKELLKIINDNKIILLKTENLKFDK
jgi:predicted nuclease of restriction endonuclease-like (RecB) superfamily